MAPKTAYVTNSNADAADTNDSIIMDGAPNKPSPLRNSTAVNRPFQSPLRSVLSPIRKIDQTEKGLKNLRLQSSPKNLLTPEKRKCRQPQLWPKKICQESKQEETETEKNDVESIDESDLKRIRDRISAKRQELEHLKQQLLYQKKHEFKNLNDLTERWLRGCQEALIQFQKDIHQHSGSPIEMIEILAQLGIPPKLVQYSIEDCDFV